MTDRPDSWRALAALVPDWTAPPGVRAFVTGRAGGVSIGSWGLEGDLPGGLNLGARCGDDPLSVETNRRRLAAALPAAPRWLRQVHGADVHVAQAGRAEMNEERDAEEPRADAAITDCTGVVLAVVTADCLPVFLADSCGRAVGVVHAGWRGLALGVLESTVAAMRQRLPGAAAVQAWMGPAIGPDAFEVGREVRATFCDNDEAALAAFLPGRGEGKWQTDLYQLARLRLERCGVTDIGGGGFCTHADPRRFWSYRRRRESGRMASVIWIDA